MNPQESEYIPSPRALNKVVAGLTEIHDGLLNPAKDEQAANWALRKVDCLLDYLRGVPAPVDPAPAPKILVVGDSSNPFPGVSEAIKAHQAAPVPLQREFDHDFTPSSNQYFCAVCQERKDHHIVRPTTVKDSLTVSAPVPLHEDKADSALDYLDRLLLDSGFRVEIEINRVRGGLKALRESVASLTRERDEAKRHEDGAIKAYHSIREELEATRRERDAMRAALELAVKEFSHEVPGSCWSTGPLTGTAEDDVCRGCMVIRAASAGLAPSPTKDAEPELPAAPLFPIPAGLRVLQPGEEIEKGDYILTKTMTEWIPLKAEIFGGRVRENDRIFFFRPVATPADTRAV